MADRTVRGIIAAVLCVAALGIIPTAQAAPPAQGTLAFDDEQPLTGSLGAGVDQALFTFACRQTGVGSVHVVTTSGDLEVQIAVLDPANQPFATGGKVSSDPNVSTAEAFVSAVDGECAVQLSRVGQTQGDYAIRLLPGYAQLDKWDTFNGSTDGLNMYWEPYASDTLQVDTLNQQLLVNVTTENMLGYAVPDGENLIWSDLYIQADIQIEGAPSYAEYGFLVRENVDEDTFYSFTFSSDGDYSLYFFDSAEWQVVQDWTVSPAVDGLAKQARIGLWVDGYTFRAYFNGRLAAEITDPTQYATEGTISLAAGTGRDQMDPLGVFFDNVVITRPFAGKPKLPFGGTGLTLNPTPTTPSTGLTGILGGNQTATPVPTLPPLVFPTLAPTMPPSNAPRSLSHWNSASAEDIMGELQAAGIVPPGGAVTMTVPSSYGDTSAPEWSYYQLASDRTFRNFVLSFDARLVSGALEAGCGMAFRDTGDEISDAIVFADGGALLGEWLFSSGDNADLSEATVYGDTSTVIPGVGVTNKVVVVALEDMMLMYINGQLFADTRFVPVSGTMALEMYVPPDDAGATEQTYCQLNNVWLWEF